MSAEAAVQYFRSKDFALDAGVQLPELVVAHQTYGERKDVNGQVRPVVLVSTCFGEVLKGRSNVLIGKGEPLDPSKYYIIRVGLLGGSDSSSPSNTPAPYSGADFPHTTYSDNVRGHILLLKSLGIDIHKEKLEAVVGFSMGGQIAYHWGALYPDRVKLIVCLATSARTSQHNIAFLEGPKGALKASGSYEAGSKGPAAFGHAYCAWAYSHDWFEQRRWEEAGATSLMDFMGKNWEFATWNGYDLLQLANCWQAGDVTKATHEAGGKYAHTSYEEALRNITCRALVMPTRTDQYFVPEDSEVEVKHLPNANLNVVETIYGHVGGGGGGCKQDNDFIANAVRKALDA